MGNLIWSLSVIVALVVFIAALAQGKNFGVALRMGVGVLIIGLAAVFVLNILGWALGFLLSLLWVAVWVAIVYGLIVVAGKAIKGAG
ncbi:MAG: hypothetical protein GYA63_04935 [Armatimonadetes bacterium]|jgi:hypothetical protein|nr:hypothetical protein [Armatimonadota bacterium]HOC31102.1 hypothetical protein [Armatimonadota bacterium]